MFIPTRRLAAAAVSFACAAAPAAASDDQAAMQAFLDANLRGFAEAPEIVSAVAAQNAITAGYDQAEIDALDQTWRAEVGAVDTPLISGVLDNQASDFLRARIEAGKGSITEVFVMDARGLNVATALVTSDYWQGDEEKFYETFAKGPDATHFGEVERDESTGIYQAQISFTLTDPATGVPIGAMTVGVNAEALF
ncbi:MAG: hypothetical protein KDK10_08550 [Maritimibacter sp.]|nr:hypothetical protein [Maritimibacter sp.]